jgi:hypothetical protein
VFQSNPDFVFHECGFEAGDEDEFGKMMKFVSERTSNTTRLEERIRAIWQAILLGQFYFMIIFSVAGIASQWMSTIVRL